MDVHQPHQAHPPRNVVTTLDPEDILITLKELRPLVVDQVDTVIHQQHLTPYRIYPGVSSRVYSSYTSSGPSTFKTYSIPYVAHKRLVTGTRVLTSPFRYVSRSSPVRVISTPIRYVSSRSSPMRVISSPARIIGIGLSPAVLNREFRRIESLHRPMSMTSASNQYLYSPEVLKFDDETRDIRTSTVRLLQKVNTPIRRARSVTPFSSTRYDYDNVSSLGYDANESYYNYLSRPTKSVRSEIERMSHWAAPARKYVGKSHLASIRICGDRGYATRKSRVEELLDDKVRKDVNLMSYYLKNRRAASELESAKLDPFRPSRKFTQPKPLEDPKAELKEMKAARLEKFSAISETDEIDLEKSKAKRMEARRLQEEQAVAEEKARKAEVARQEKLANEAAAARAAELERKAQQAEEERVAKEAELEALERQAEWDKRRLEEEKRLAEEAVIAEARRVEEEKAAAEEAARLAEEEAARVAAENARLAAEEEKRAAEEAAAELERQAEEKRLAEEAEAARLAEEEEAARVAENARLAEESRLADEARLAEIEQDGEGDIARQAAELAEIARQEDLARAAEQQQSQAEDLSVAESEPIVEEPATPVPAEENNNEDVSEVHDTLKTDTEATLTEDEA